MTAHSTFGERMYAMLAQEMGHANYSPSPHVDDLSDTPTLKVAMEGPEQDKWLTTIENKLQSIKDEKLYELVDPSKEHIENLLGNKLVLDFKRGPTGNIKHYKACLTARWDCQQESIDYEETFAPVVKSASLQVFFALAAKMALHICHLDVTAAFLNGTLREMVYMWQLKGFEEAGKETWVWKLNQALYRLKQGGCE